MFNQRTFTVFTFLLFVFILVVTSICFGKGKMLFQEDWESGVKRTFKGNRCENNRVSINNGNKTEKDNLVSSESFYLEHIALIGHDGF